MIAFKAHFDGKYIVPDEPLDVPRNTPLEFHVQVPTASTSANLKRRGGLFPDAIDWISPDFDAPLPDEFWLGKE